jgi:hypothetical protein
VIEPSRCSILGMPLDVDDDDAITSCQPVSGFAVIKALDENGEVCYLTAATDGLKSVECLGMVEYAALKLRHGLAEGLADE